MILGLRQAKASYHNVNKKATLLEILSNQTHMVKSRQLDASAIFRPLLPLSTKSDLVSLTDKQAFKCRRG